LNKGCPCATRILFERCVEVKMTAGIFKRYGIYPGRGLLTPSKFSNNAFPNMMSMSSSTREDYLEALCILSRKSPQLPTVRDLAVHLSLDPSELEEHLDIMEHDGDIQLLPGERIRLTEKGLETGTRVMKKHQVLARFLSEVLGMDPGAASEEACILEHDISDETYQRLDWYIRRPRRRGHRMQMGRPNLPTLIQFPEGTDLKVLSVRCPGGCERLSDMGIFPGERIKIIHTLNNKAVVVQVKGCDIALSPEIASCIFVEKSE